MAHFPAAVFLLCFITCAMCAALLLRQYRHTKIPLLFWSFLCFGALTINNALVFIDLIVFPNDVSLLAYRYVASIIAVGVLLYGFIFEAD